MLSCCSGPQPDSQPHFKRRELHQAAVSTLLSTAMAAAIKPQPAAAAIACPGMRGRELQQCLKKARQEREGAGGRSDRVFASLRPHCSLRVARPERLQTI